MICNLKVVFVICVTFLTYSVSNISAQDKNIQESEQEIRDFSLTGFGEKGKKTWDLQAESADIFQDFVKLKNIVGNLYTEKGQNIRITGDRGDFDKRDGRMRLEQNVVITTSDGAKLTTDSLDWDRKNQTVLTEDLVNIERQNLKALGWGAKGHPDLHKVTLDKHVRVDINSQEVESQMTKEQDKIVITCYGPLEIDYNKNVAIFKNNVKVNSKDGQIFSDRMEVYFVKSDEKETQESDKESDVVGTKIEKIIARGNVKIVRGENVSYSEEAIYTASDRKIVLVGSPKLIIYSTEDFNASSGN